MKEYELFEPAKKFMLNKFACSEVYGEVYNIDVLGRRGDLLIAFELKTSLNFKVIEQASDRFRYVDYSFILVPEPKNYPRPFILDWIKSLNIGLLFYSNDNVRLVFWGKRNRKPYNKGVLDTINREKEFSKFNVGGVKGGESITAYKVTIERIKNYLYYYRDGVNINQLLSDVQSHYSSPKPSTMSTLQAHWNSDWCEVIMEGRNIKFKMKDSYREYYDDYYGKLPIELQILYSN